MRIIKTSEKFRNRLIQEYKIRIIIWILPLAIWFYLIHNQIEFGWYLLSGWILFLPVLYFFAKSDSIYEIKEVELSKKNMLIKYFEKDTEKLLKLNPNVKLTIELNRQSRGIFPLNNKNRVESIKFRDDNGQLIVQQVRNRNWKSEELHELFYDGLEKYYNWYWRGEFEVEIVKNN